MERSGTGFFAKLRRDRARYLCKPGAESVRDDARRQSCQPSPSAWSQPPEPFVPFEFSNDPFAIYQTRSRNKPFKFCRGTYQQTLPPYRGASPSVIRFLVIPQPAIPPRETFCLGYPHTGPLPLPSDWRPSCTSSIASNAISAVPARNSGPVHFTGQALLNIHRHFASPS